MKRARDLQRARVRLRELVVALGGQCIACGEEELDALTIDHADGITWNRYALRYDARIGRYWREFRDGVRLRVLCMLCNASSAVARELRELEQLPAAPF